MSEYVFLNPTPDEEAEATAPYTDVAWDYCNDKPIFKNGEPVIATELEAVKSWAYRALKTRRYAQLQNSWDYGNDIYALVGQPWLPETKIAEARRYTEECLLQNPYITGVEDFTADFFDDTVRVAFLMQTRYGATEITV